MLIVFFLRKVQSFGGNILGFSGTSEAEMCTFWKEMVDKKEVGKSPLYKYRLNKA